MVLELRGDRPLDGPVARVVGPGGHLVDHQAAAGRRTARRPARRSPRPPRPPGGRARPPAAATSPGRGGPAPGPPGTPRRPGPSPRPARSSVRPLGPPGHQHGQLGVEGHQLFDQQRDRARGGLPAHLGRLGRVGHRPHAPAVVAAPGRLEHDRPAVAGGEGLDRPERGIGVLVAGRARRRPGRGCRGRPARCASGLVDGQLQGGRRPGRTATRSPASRASSARSTSSWSKVTTSQRAARAGQGVGIVGRAHQDLGPPPGPPRRRPARPRRPRRSRGHWPPPGSSGPAGRLPRCPPSPGRPAGRR